MNTTWGTLLALGFGIVTLFLLYAMWKMAKKQKQKIVASIQNLSEDPGEPTNGDSILPLQNEDQDIQQLTGVEKRLFKNLKEFEELWCVLTMEQLVLLDAAISDGEDVLKVTATFRLGNHDEGLVKLLRELKEYGEIIVILPNSNTEKDQIAADIIIAVEPDAKINIKGVQIEQMYPS